MKYLKYVARKLGWGTLGIAVRLRQYGLLVAVFSRIVEELHADGTVSRAAVKSADDRPTVLFLSYEQFRHDAEGLAATGQIRLLRLAERWQTRLMFQFYPVEIGQDSYRHYFNPTPEDRTWLPKKAYREFLRIFLPLLLERLGVQVLVGHHVHYIPDFDWGAVADGLGYPFVVINRENLFATDFLKRTILRRISDLGKFEGRYVTVHHELTRDLFSKSEFVDEDKLKVLGCIRMDGFLQSIRRSRENIGGKRRITFFTFMPDPSCLEMEDILPLFTEVYRAVIETAHDNADLEITFKVKPNFLGSWKLLFETTFPEYQGIFDELENLHLSTTIPAHDLIARSQVIVGLNSTTIVEAAVAGCQVIVPYYGPLKAGKYDDRVFYRDNMALFQVPGDVDQFKRMLLECFEAPPISDQVMAGRMSLFEEYVSQPDGQATQRHIELLRNLCNSPT